MQESGNFLKFQKIKIEPFACSLTNTAFQLIIKKFLVGKVDLWCQIHDLQSLHIVLSYK